MSLTFGGRRARRTMANAPGRRGRRHSEGHARARRRRRTARDRPCCFALSAAPHGSDRDRLGECVNSFALAERARPLACRLPRSIENQRSFAFTKLFALFTDAHEIELQRRSHQRSTFRIVSDMVGAGAPQSRTMKTTGTNETTAKRVHTATDAAPDM